MAEEIQEVDEQQTEQPQGEQAEPKPTTDWKAEARKWEARAKKSEAAEAELEKLKAAQMSEQERANARAEKAEAELEAMRAESERARAAREVSDEKGVPLWMLEGLADRDAMEAFAARYEQEKPQVHAAAASPASRVVKGDVKPPTTAQQFADAIESF